MTFLDKTAPGLTWFREFDDKLVSTLTRTWTLGDEGIVDVFLVTVYDPTCDRWYSAMGEHREHTIERLKREFISYSLAFRTTSADLERAEKPWPKCEDCGGCPGECYYNCGPGRIDDNFSRAMDAYEKTKEQLNG